MFRGWHREPKRGPITSTVTQAYPIGCRSQPTEGGYLGVIEGLGQPTLHLRQSFGGDGDRRPIHDGAHRDTRSDPPPLLSPLHTSCLSSRRRSAQDNRPA